MLLFAFFSPQDMDSMRGDQRKASTQHSAVEVRLNRALEEVDKHKTALQKARSESKVCVRYSYVA